MVLEHENGGATFFVLSIDWIISPHTQIFQSLKVLTEMWTRMAEGNDN
jgi:hypothetical protein